MSVSECCWTTGDCTPSSLCKGAREQDGGVGEDGAGAEEAGRGGSKEDHEGWPRRR